MNYTLNEAAMRAELASAIAAGNTLEASRLRWTLKLAGYSVADVPQLDTFGLIRGAK